MSTDYINLIKKTKRKKQQPRLLIKNGVQFFITLTTDKKPKFKKPKNLKTKKWIIKDVLLHAFRVDNKEEITEIIAKDANQQQSYDKCFQMTTNLQYELLLSHNQLDALIYFLTKNNIGLGTKFSFIRIGSGFNTRIIFSQISLKTEK